MSPKEIYEDMVDTIREDAPSYSTVKKWVVAFKLGRISTKNEHGPGRPVESVTQENIDKIHDLVMLVRRMRVRQIEETLGIPKTTVDRIMREHLGLRKLSSRWVPKLLTPDQKAVRRKLSPAILCFLKPIQRNLLIDLLPWMRLGPITLHQSPSNNPCNGDTPVPLPSRKPRQFHQQERLWKIVYHQDKAPSHRSLQAMATIYDSGFELLPHAPYSPDLAPSDFNLFPHLKKSLSGIPFRSDEEINPDNVAAPLASAFGDVTTLWLLTGTSYILASMDNCWVMVGLLLAALSLTPMLALVARGNPSTRQALKEAWPPIILGIFLSSGSGLLLSVVVKDNHALAAFQPVINGTLTMGVVFASHRLQINPDNVAAPLASAFGDVTTLWLLTGTSYILASMDNCWVMVGLLLAALSLTPMLALVARGNPSTRQALKEAWPPIILGIFLSRSGNNLTSVKFEHSCNVPCTGVGGNLVAIHASKMSTFLHKELPTHLPLCFSPSSVFSKEDPNGLSARALLAVGIPGHAVFLTVLCLVQPAGSREGLPAAFLVLYVACAALQVTMLLYTTQVLVTALWKVGVDPDNTALPCLTALGDLLDPIRITLTLKCVLHIAHINRNLIKINILHLNLLAPPTRLLAPPTTLVAPPTKLLAPPTRLLDPPTTLRANSQPAPLSPKPFFPPTSCLLFSNPITCPGYSLCKLHFPLKRLRFQQSTPFSTNNKKFRNEIATNGSSRQDSMESNQDSIGVKKDDPTREREEEGSRQEAGPLADVIRQFTAALSQGRSCDPTGPTISPFDGTYSASQFFQAFDRKMEESMEEKEKLLRLPNYLARQPLELFRKLRLADRSYFQVRQILLDLYPESSEASFAKYFAMKLTGQANLETYYREKTAMGLQLGLPQEVILETLTEGLPFSDQRLVRVVPPENLGEWFRLVQRIHGPSVPGMHLFHRPTVSSAARGTGTANADIDQSRRPTKKNGQCNQSQADIKVPGQCNQSQNNQSQDPSNHLKPETPQQSRLFETEVGSLTQLTVKLFLAPNIPCPFLIDTGASLNIVPYNLYNMLKTRLPKLNLKRHSLDLQTLDGFAKTMGKLSLPLTIGQISRRENFHVVNAPLPFGILSLNSLHKFKLAMDFNKCTIFQLGAPLSTPSYHFNHVPNVCTYWQCQAMSQRYYPTAKLSAYDNHCVHSLNKPPLSTCHFFTKANCLFYMPSNNKATTASIGNHNAQNIPIQRDNSHTKHIGDHTPSHNYHMTNPHNELDTHTKTQQNPLPHTCYNTTHNPLYTPQSTTLLQRYNHIFTQNKFNVPCLRIPPVKIPTNSDKIITIRPYRVPICDQQEIRNQVRQMLENGIIEQSFSPFSSPVTLVTKRDKTKRFCIDYRKVNELISSDVHPLPRIEDILDRLAQAKYFSTADISSAYWQVPIHPDSRPLLAFATLEGLYQPTRLPFGLKTSPQIYERAMSQVLQRHGLDCVAHYFDDFIIYSNTLEEHQNHLRQFFAFCEAEELQLNLAKCEFFKQSIDFLGYTISWLFRWSLRLSSYEYEVRYIKGKQQYEADLLSRNPFCGFLDVSLIKTHQPPPSRESSLTIDRNGLHTVSRKGVTKIIIPKPLIQQLLQTVHAQYNHPGISQMSRLISTQYYWQGMSKDIKQKVKTCPTCQLTKRPLGPTYGELSQPPEAKEPFDLLSLDTIAGFAKYGNTKIYLHVVVDHFSRYAWTFPSKSTSITTYQQVLKRVLQDGSPKRLLTDRAPAFTSPKFSSFLLNRNIHSLLTTSNNPQANGLCERLNATLTGKLRLLHLENPKIAWTKLVKRVTVIYNKTPHSTTGFPPTNLMFGILPPELSDHSTPYPDIDRARKIAHTRTQNKHLQDKTIYDQRHKQPHFEVGDLVLVKLYHHPNTGKLAPYFTGPHTVLEIISPNVVRIDRPNQPLQRDTDTIHVNKLKLYTETVRYISPPAVRICHIKHKPDYTFPFKHFTPELFPAEPLRFKPTNSEPFRHLDPAIFSTRRFTPFFPDIKNCKPDNHLNPTILSPKRYTPLPNDNKQCEIERPTMNKVRANISESPFMTIGENMYRYPIFHLIFILCLLVLPYKCTPVLFLSYLLTYIMPSNRVFELQEAVFNIGQAFVKLLIILGNIFAENLNKFRGDRSN
ncbi:hypothetical protein LAZ67_4001455 [Cordylochernes scorpioides]|uniref:RNA-directed DNA polymerase n=1 Tax=Cordylochernes scorpioides TaxID=51811 RepID=A0ABY6KEY4_9ARAC|nr:hypothetical protein LAZ67_4001455 [Cordylochernes scorpioides]